MADPSLSSTSDPSRWQTVPPSRDSAVPDRLDQYRLIKELGRGGMGVVYQAEDELLRRTLALKLIRPEFAMNEPLRARFLREARAVAALKHDNIVTVYQVGEDRGIPFLAMELLKGKSLDEWLRPDRRASPVQTLAIAKQAARGLIAAHEVGLIHRDIKPPNLWLEAPHGRVKLLDFGLARKTEGEFTELTQHGATLGTPAFMSPEQARGETVDPRTDLFSVGCVLYRMVTGRLPFQGNTTYAVLAALASEIPTPPHLLNPDVVPRLSDLISRLLAKDPADRPQSSAELLEELSEIERQAKAHAHVSLPDEPKSTPERSDLAAELFFGAVAPTPPTASSGRRRRSWIAATLFALAVLTFALMNRSFRSPPPAVAGDTTSAPISGTSAEREEVSKPVDLIGLIEIKRDTFAGEWRWMNGALIGHSLADSRFCIELPWDPPPAYRLSFKASRKDDNPGPLAVGLRAGGRPVFVVIDAPVQNKGKGPLFYSGPSHVNGQSKNDRSMGRWIPRMSLPPGRSVSVVCSVQPGRLELGVDGMTIYQGSLDELQRMARREGETTAPLALAGRPPARFRFTDIMLEPLGPERGHPLYDPK